MKQKNVKKVKRYGLSKFEKFLYGFALFLLISTPLYVSTSLINIGVISFPSFAIDETAVIKPIGVTWNLWPKDIVASSVSLTFWIVWKIPLASPGKSIPVFSVRPNASMYL